MLEEIPFLGAGLGFRRVLKDEILASRGKIDFLEIISDQYIDRPLIKEEEAVELAQKFPVVLHGVDLSIGTDCPIDDDYLKKIHHVARLTKPKWVSDHLCFTGVPGHSLGQLTPLPFTDNTVRIVVEHIKQISATFDCPFLVENISYYFLISPTTMSEAEFITRVVGESGCGLLLDLANVRNNAINNNYDPIKFLDQIPLDRVVQIHLAGSSFNRGLMIDTHSHPVDREVFEMLRYTAPKMPMLKGVIVERDQNYPPFEELLAELDQIRDILASDWKPYHASGIAGELSKQMVETAAHVGVSS